MFSRISDLLPRLRIYEQLFPNHELLVQSLSVIYFDILTFCSDAKNMFRRAKRTMLSLVWKPFERQFGSHMDAFRRHQEETEKNVSLSHMIEAADSRALIRSNQMEIAKRSYGTCLRAHHTCYTARSRVDFWILDQERLGIFASLSSAVDYEAQHRKLRGLRHEGTGTWLIQHPTYVDWKESTASEGLFIHGIRTSFQTLTIHPCTQRLITQLDPEKASSRKLSAVHIVPDTNFEPTRSLIVDNHLERSTCPTKNALYFYCDYANPPTLQLVHMYRALLQQLFFRGLMSEAMVKNVVEILRFNSNGLSEQRLTNLISNAIQCCAGLHIIVDWLDECERGVQQAVTNTLGRLLTFEHPLIKILFTCRDEGHLLTSLNHFSRLQISHRASAADIQSYISHAIAQSLSSGDLTIRNPVLKEEIISKLVDKAQGMYV